MFLLTDQTNKDVFSAIDFAAQYPFRAGASKVIVVLPCSDCSSSQLSYRSVAARLNSENINVHVINDFAFEVTVDGKNPPTNYLFGKLLILTLYHDVRCGTGVTGKEIHSALIVYRCSG